MWVLWLLLYVFMPISGHAQSRTIELRNNFNSSIDDYRNRRSISSKCSAYDLARTYAKSLMGKGDATNAKRWNSMLPSTGCRLTPLIIDPSADKQSSSPEVNQALTTEISVSGTGSCLPFKEIMTIDITKKVQATCPGGGFIFIKAN